MIGLIFLMVVSVMLLVILGISDKDNLEHIKIELIGIFKFEADYSKPETGRLP